MTVVLCLNCISGSTQKPEDMYRIIEHFALGRRRLELFGEDHNIRAGWLTVGKELSSSNFLSEVAFSARTQYHGNFCAYLLTSENYITLENLTFAWES